MLTLEHGNVLRLERNGMKCTCKKKRQMKTLSHKTNQILYRNNSFPSLFQHTPAYQCIQWLARLTTAKALLENWESREVRKCHILNCLFFSSRLFVIIMSSKNLVCLLDFNFARLSLSLKSLNWIKRVKRPSLFSKSLLSLCSWGWGCQMSHWAVGGKGGNHLWVGGGFRGLSGQWNERSQPLPAPHSSTRWCHHVHCAWTSFLRSAIHIWGIRFRSPLNPSSPTLTGCFNYTRPTWRL